MAEPSSKDLVRGLFRLDDLPRPPFLPWVCTFAAQLEQVQVEDMLSDAGILATSLTNAPARGAVSPSAGRSAAWGS